MKTVSDSEIRVLIVGMADSVHLARWVLQFEGRNFKFELISSSPHRSVHPDIRKLLKNDSTSSIDIRMSPLSRYLALPMWLADRLLNDFLRGALIRRSIRTFKPEIVHALELQNAGYSTSVAFSKLRSLNKPKLLITNYGSEIIWFKQYPKHLIKLKKLMALADAFSAECSRDVQLAKEIGFTGRVMKTIPVSGGVNVKLQMTQAPLMPPEQRGVIAVKGYQNRWGQALVALDAIKKIAPLILDFKIEIFSCNKKTIRAARKIAAQTGLRITTYKKKSLSHGQVLDILKESRVYIGLSKSDGISTSMIEAMSQGAVPIQSNSSCGNEWIRDGIDGFLVEFDDVDGISDRLLFLLKNSNFSQVAQKKNFETICEKYDSSKVSKIACNYYTELST